MRLTVSHPHNRLSPTQGEPRNQGGSSVAQKKRRTFQAGTLDERPDKDGNIVYSLLYRLRDASTPSGWRLTRETLTGIDNPKEAKDRKAKRMAEINELNNGQPDPPGMPTADALPPGSNVLTFKRFAEGPLWASHLKK